MRTPFFANSTKFSVKVPFIRSLRVSDLDIAAIDANHKVLTIMNDMCLLCAFGFPLIKLVYCMSYQNLIQWHHLLVVWNHYIR